MSYFRQNLKNINTKQFIILVVLTFFSLLFLFPVIWMAVTSFRPTKELYTYPLSIIPRELSLENYKYVFEEMSLFLRYFLNSIIVTFSSVVIVVLSSSLGGYAFGVRRFKGKNLLFMGIVLILTIPYIVYLIPIYMMEQELGLSNTWLGLILPYVAINLPWGLLIMRGAFSTIPLDIRDAAMIDGCNEYQLWYRIMLPITR